MRVNDRENYNKIKKSINMDNLKKIINSKDFMLVKVAMNSKISVDTIKSYISGNKIPSLPTLVSMADYLDCNLDYLIGRADNPIKVNDIETLSNNPEIKLLMQNISSLSKDKQQLVMAYVRGLLKN